MIVNDQSSPVLSFIILTWNSEQYLHANLNSIVRACSVSSLSCEIIVVDNGSSDRSLEIIAGFDTGNSGTVKCIALGNNKGTTFSRNLGLREARGTYICVIDSDTEIIEGDLRTILRKLDDDPVIGIVAPRLVLCDGTIQNSVKRFPAFWLKLWKIPKALLGLQLCDHDFYADFPFDDDKIVDSAISACWFFRRDLLDAVGLLDEKIFYSPEDLDYCLRVWKSGRKILYSPSITVIHHTQQISHKKPLSLISLRHFSGLLYYFNKHGGWFCAPRYSTNNQSS